MGYWAPRDPSGSLLNPRVLVLLFIMVVTLIYVFVLDESLTSQILHEDQTTKCCEPLQKLRMRLWPCNIDLSPPVILYY